MNNTNTSISNRQRFKNICYGKRPGDFMMMDWFHRCWSETIEEWIKQGAPENIRTQEGLNEYFGFDHFHGLQEIISEHNRSDLKEIATVQAVGSSVITPPIMPVFEIKVISEDSRHRIQTTYGGQLVEINKEYPSRMPKYLDHPVKDRKSWREYKKRLDPETPERWPKNWRAFCESINNDDSPTMLLLEGFFGVLREWTGLERLLFMFYDDPTLVEDMMEQVLHFDLGIAKRALKDLQIDCVRFWEDMAYKTGPLISPDMFKKFMVPRYKRIVDFIRSNGVDIIHVDSDGNINELIPLWLEVEVNFPWPLEVAANMDAVALRKKYGNKLILSGNIDKRLFNKGKKAILKEITSKVPYLTQTGGYFPCLDHAVPPDVSLENFCYYINLLREIAGKDKLPE